MNIAFSVDNNFIKQLTVTITSILLNSDQHDEFNFYVLDGGILDDNKNKIEKLKSIKNFDIKYIKIEHDAFEKCPIFGHFSKATYYRFKLPSLINSDKILYMDCDILVKKSLSELYNTKFHDNYAVVVEDPLNNKDAFLKKNLNVKKYFNAGIMLLNLEKMREDDIENKCFNFVERYPEKIQWVDQCVLNAVFEEKVKFVDKKYNFKYLFDGHLKDYKNKIVVLHFVGDKKPWDLGVFHQCKMEYYYYLSKTPFNNNLFIIALKEIKYILLNPKEIKYILLNFVEKLKLTFQCLVWSFIN